MLYLEGQVLEEEVADFFSPLLLKMLQHSKMQLYNIPFSVLMCPEVGTKGGKVLMSLSISVKNTCLVLLRRVEPKAIV